MANKSKTDWERIRTMTDEQALRGARTDPDSPPITAAAWAGARPLFPKKKDVHIKLDEDLVDYFKQIKDGKRGYQTLINAVLRQYVEHQRRAG